MDRPMTRARGRNLPAIAVVLVGLLMLRAPQARADVECGVGVGTLSFGTYEPTAPQANDSTGRADVTCNWAGGSRANKLVLYQLTLSTGNSGDYNQRQMFSGSDRLPYNLFIDAARARIWGDGSSGTGIGSGSMRIGSGQGNRTDTRDHTIYGRIPAQVDVNSGSYNDTIYVTLIF
jgi:spore coat protein U-like protein